MSNLNLETIYKARLENLSNQLKKLQQRKKSLAWLRLLSFLAAFIISWIILNSSLLFAAFVFVILISVFIIFVSKDLTNSNSIENNLLLASINQKEIAALDHQYLDFPDGMEWKPEQHSYANDLDIFGRASVYQYCNRTNSEQGNKLFADWLTTADNIDTIHQKQEAVKELTKELDWRQQLQAAGIKNKLTIRTEENICKWLNEDNRFINNNFWKAARILFPLISLTITGLYIINIIQFNQFLPIILLMLAIAFWISKLIMPSYFKLNKVTGELETLAESIALIEKKSFNSKYLTELNKAFVQTGSTASGSIKKLKKILDRLDYRLNPVVFIPLSALLCWDLQQIFALEKWKSINKENTSNWFSSLAGFEAVSSLANLSFNHPQWCFPILHEGEPFLEMDDMGHPLIPPAKRVDNSYSTRGTNQVSLITGSNMAGKSTFLRSTGVNIVLAMMGSPVCAKQFSMSPLKVMSSMRVSDNLEESTSTFYAELKKLKEIIEAVYRNEKVFLLLDEILRGTNSADRHTGSTALIKQLIHHNAIGMVATHDLELAKLADTYPDNIHNYHFDVKVENDELYFDYKLNRGICQSMNASILMKKIGIEL